MASDRMRDRWEGLITGQAKGPMATLGRLGLEALAGLYGAGLQANHAIYNFGLKARTVPALPVISVGNLSLGGTGKTTATAYIARLLSDRCMPGIVLRGYRRRSERGPVLVSDGERVLAPLEEAGDEAIMLARSLPGCAVAVGKRREVTIELLRNSTGVRIVILDDGFQYFRMARRLDIVLLDALAGSGGTRLFPAGRLREPWQNLARAHQIWITHADLAPVETVEKLAQLASRHCPGGLLCVTRHQTGALRPLINGMRVSERLEGLHVLALSGLGNPVSFERGLEELGARVTPLRFADHHAYSERDWHCVRQACEAASADLIVTTEKDAVKLPDPPADSPPVAVLGCELAFMQGEDAARQQISEVCEELDGGENRRDPH